MAYGESRVRKRKKKSNSGIKIAIIVLVLVCAIVGIVFAVKAITDNKEPEETEVVTLEPESSLEKSVKVEGVNINGMGKTQAKIAIEKKLGWDMKAKLAGVDPATYEIANLLEKSIEDKLDQIYALDTPDESYQIDFKIDDAQLDAEIEAMKALWNKEPVNGTISGYDKETESFTYSEGENGMAIDEEKLRSDIREAFISKKYNASVDVKADTVEPFLNEEAAKALYTTIGTFTTNSTANADRNSNLNLACNTIDGTLLQAGEEFSFNLTTGNRTAERGYKEAAAYQNGEIVNEPGGGVCQVASTLYNALVKAGITVTERHAHTYAPTYVTPGEDATVSYDGYNGPDLKFVNNTEAAVVIRAHYQDRTVTCWLIGIPILEEGEEISLHSEKVATTDVPAPIIEDDPTLEAGVQIEVSKGDQGSTWNTYIKHVYPEGSGKETTDELLHVSRYKGHTPKVRRNQALWTADYDTVPTDANGETLELKRVKDEAGNVILYYETESETEPSAPEELVPEGPGSESETVAPKNTDAPGSSRDDAPGGDDEDDLVPGIPIFPSDN